MNVFSFVIFMSTFSLFAQVDELKNTGENARISAFYIFESTWGASMHSRVYTVDDSPNYLQLEGTRAVIVSRARERFTFLEGEIDGFYIEEEEGEEIIRFYVRGRDRSIGRIASFEIRELEGGKFEIHYFNKFGRFDWYYLAHRATQEEIQAIIDYWKSY